MSASDFLLSRRSGFHSGYLAVHPEWNSLSRAEQTAGKGYGDLTRGVLVSLYVKGRSVGETATALRTNANNVSQIKNRFQRALDTYGIRALSRCESEFAA